MTDDAACYVVVQDQAGCYWQLRHNAEMTYPSPAAARAGLRLAFPSLRLRRLTEYDGADVVERYSLPGRATATILWLDPEQEQGQ